MDNYEAPQIRTLGSVEELTQAGKPGGVSDLPRPAQGKASKKPKPTVFS